MVLFRRKGRSGRVDGAEQGAEPYHEVNLEGLLAMIDGIMGSGSSIHDRASPGFRDALQITRRLNQHIGSLKGVSEGLQRRRVGADTPSQIRGIIERAKSTMVSVIAEVSRPIQEPADLHDIALVLDKARRILNRLGDASGSHRRILYEFFPSEARALKDILMAMKSDIDALDAIARDVDEMGASHSRCRERIAGLVQMEQEIRIYTARIREVEDRLSSLEMRRAGIEERRKEIVSDSGYIELRDSLNRTREEYGRLLSDVAGDFSRLGRVVSKYAHEVGFERDEHALLRAIMDEPAGLKDADAETIRDILARLGESISSGRLHLKNPEKDLENVNRLMDRLGHYIFRLREHDAMIRAYTERIRPYEDMLRDLDVEMEHVDREIRHARDTLEGYRARISALRSAISEGIQVLQDEVHRLYGLRVRINVDVGNSGY